MFNVAYDFIIFSKWLTNITDINCNQYQLNAPVDVFFVLQYLYE